MAKILFVEDDDFIRESVSQIIEEWGYTVLVAGDVDEALAVLESSQDIDALITDLTLKRANYGGYELSRRAVEQRPSMRVLYTSGNARNQHDIHRSVPGAQFIQKPYREENLRRIVDALFAVSF